jgi:uncharacterized membrane protein
MRINNWYHTILGLLAGISLMSLFTIINMSTKQAYVGAYAAFSNSLCLVMQIFCGITLVFATALTLIYKQKADELMRNLDKNRLEFR